MLQRTSWSECQRRDCSRMWGLWRRLQDLSRIIRLSTARRGWNCQKTIAAGETVSCDRRTVQRDSKAGSASTEFSIWTNFENSWRGQSMARMGILLLFDNASTEPHAFFTAWHRRTTSPVVVLTMVLHLIGPNFGEYIHNVCILRMIIETCCQYAYTEFWHSLFTEIA